MKKIFMFTLNALLMSNYIQAMKTKIVQDKSSLSPIYCRTNITEQEIGALAIECEASHKNLGMSQSEWEKTIRELSQNLSEELTAGNILFFMSMHYIKKPCGNS